ncbi:nucleotidyl transferase AbiEii/AbiGii toxin family protein [Mycobacteroides abscessus]|uniref:nucleotidyl transferase AbiEii/AbiGii toxin family protein n=1 Tax=Mycobacteroides abscessus TaxID=36809 RepID=UPI000C25B7DD|nr:nucleotidyl transferase AbiEii/AbiGii toxin family protein [Mycobacteroides abscessus]MDO3203827.1 nucleotidyl transferase AbiEii/AbiGii toxin family protein [Mycobacteroides abscessus subsp. abscessus]
MALWREDDPEIFTATIVAAAEQLGVQPLAVEKDYWICEVLRAIVAAHREEIVFKGGTSLEKLRIIQRFSEDLDLLVLGDYANVRAAKRAMKVMLDTAASAIGVEYRDRKSAGDLGTATQEAWLDLPLTQSDQLGGLADPKSVLVELGQAGGPKPVLQARVESLLYRELMETDLVGGQWDDLRAFEVAILHPGRTLIEKLLRVNNFVADPAKRATLHGRPRIGRQFYDIWALLGDASVATLLADTAMFSDILASVFEVSQVYGGDHPIPDGGFAASEAFNPSGEFAKELRREHNTAMSSFHYGSERPTFDEVLERVHSCSKLLDPERS